MCIRDSPYAGGISIADKDVDREDSDRVDPWFSTGQFTNKNEGGVKSVVNGDNS
jgi:hypothetical protein